MQRRFSVLLCLPSHLYTLLSFQSFSFHANATVGSITFVIIDRKLAERKICCHIAALHSGRLSPAFALTSEGFQNDNFRASQVGMWWSRKTVFFFSPARLIHPLLDFEEHFFKGPTQSFSLQFSQEAAILRRLPYMMAIFFSLSSVFLGSLS